MIGIFFYAATRQKPAHRLNLIGRDIRVHCLQGVTVCLTTCNLQLIPVDVDSVLLAYPVRSGHGLQVVLGVPVAVKDDHGVSSGQVDAQPTCSGGQQEGKITGARGIEVLHRLHTMTCCA